jgi:hypothetical protein
MVRVQPHSYTLSTTRSTVPLGFSDRSVVDLYFVGDTDKGYEAWPDSWIMDDRSHFAHDRLPGDRYGTEVRATAEEVARWTDAQRTAENALRDAEAQYLDDLDLVVVRDRTGRTLLPAPGWKARIRQICWRRLSRRASAAYRTRTECIKQSYAPVSAEIQGRVIEAWRQWELVHEVAMKARWRYQVDHNDGVIHIVHDKHARLDTEALAKKLLDIRRGTGVAALRWDDASRAKIERRSGVDFDTWWNELTHGTWENAHTIPENELDNVGCTVTTAYVRVGGRIWPAPQPY